jgi:transmembrane sensor
MDPTELHDVLGASSRAEWERLGRYLGGRSGPDESRAVQRWIEADPRRQELVQRIQRARSSIEAAPGLWDEERAWSRLAARLEPPTAEPAAAGKVVPFRPRPAAAPSPVRHQRGRFAHALRAAAVIIALAGGAALWQGRAAVFKPGEVAMQELATGVGQQMRISLADGTAVVLGPDSRLTFPARFGRARDVVLEGEATFDVATDSARAFRVRTATSVTQVLGTRFGVRAYPDEEYAEVVVAEGRVAVAAATAEGRAASSATQLTPGFGARVRRDGTVSAPRAVDAGRALAWTEGRLAFDASPLREVVRTFERQRGIRIELADSAIGELRLTAEFRHPTAAEVARLISLSLGLEYRAVENGYLLFTSTEAADLRAGRASIP